jgi:putative flavoprotein involved in K+ transport
MEIPEDTAARAVLPDPPCLIEPLQHLDLRAANISTVIWATGYDYDFGWIDVPVLNTRGEPVHRQGITDVSGMYFLGLRWLSNFKSSLLSGIGEDAARLADHIAARQR